MIGQTISHYKILKKTGEGGMGVVYEAEDTKLRRIVALKFLPPHLTRDTEAKQRFIQEAQATSSLQHINICTIHDIDQTDDGQLFIVMDYYSGESLKARIARGPLKVEEAISTAIQVSSGLQSAHEQRIVHRDIKPANILITHDGVAKIVDFGLAKLRGRTKLTREGASMGTIEYMSPEQSRGEEIDHRTDIWSLGCVMYEMLAGHPPFKGDYEQAIVYSILNAQPEPVTSLRSGIPMELEQIIAKCLEKKQDERYQTVADVIVDLKRLQRTAGERAVSLPEKHVSPASSKKLWVTIAFLMVISVVLIMIFKPFTAQPELNRKSIAVLPFKNMSDSKEDEYFSDGLTEDIITQLSKISGIEKVIARTSVMQYKGNAKSIRDIGKELDVATILEGSVRRSGGQVRIVAQLIDTKSEGHLWAETYDREMAGIFAVQSDVAQQIAAVLRATLLPAEKATIEKQPTGNISAYDYYLKGREYYNRYMPQDNETAIGLFKKALELDTNYVLAYAGLADAYGQRYGQFGQGRQWLDSSIATSTRAIKIDAQSAEAYKALGLAYEFKGFLHKALEANRKALELNPNYNPAIGNMGDANIVLGNFVEGMEWKKKALRGNPTIALNYATMAREFAWLTDDVNIEKYSRRALELQPDLTYAYVTLLIWYLEQGRFNDAFADNEKILSLDHDTTAYDARMRDIHFNSGNISQAKVLAEKLAARGDSSYFAYFYWKEGKKEKARAMVKTRIAFIQKQIEEGNEIPDLRYYISRFYALIEEKTEALRWFRKAINDGWYGYRDAMRHPYMASLRDNEEFKRMIAEVKAYCEDQKKRIHAMESE